MAILQLLAALAFALSPILSGSFGGFAPGAFPIPQNDPPVQPAGWAFAIWGPIYLALIAQAAFGLWRRGSDPAWARRRLPLTASLAIGAAWIPIAQASPIWATLVIWLMLAAALAALLAAETGDRWLGEAPLALYAGWLLAASCVSTGLLAAGYGILGPYAAATAALLAALAAAAGLWRLRPSPGLTFAVAWAATGLFAQNWPDNRSLALLALAGALAMAGLTLAALTRRTAS